MLAHAIKSVSWAFAGKWFQMLLGVVTLAVTARILGPGPYGLYAAAILIISIGDIFVSGAPAALTQSLVQRKEINQGHQNASFWLCCAVGGSLWLIVTLSGRALGAMLDMPTVAEILPACGAFLFINALGATPFAVLVRDMRFKDVTLIDSAAAVVASALGVSLALAGAGVWSLVGMEAGRCVTKTVLAYAVSRWRPTATATWSHLRDVGAINTSVVTSAGLAYIDKNAPRLIIVTFLGADALGFYTIAMRLYDILIGLFVGPFSWVAMPMVTRSLSKPDALRAMIKVALRYASLTSYPVFVGVAAVTPMLTPLALGEQWNPAIITIQLIALSGVRVATASFNTVVLIGVGRIWEPVAIHVLGAALSVALCWLAAPYGVEAVALAMLVRSLGTMPLAAFFLVRATSIPLFDLLRQSWTALGASVVMAAAVLAVRDVAMSTLGLFGALLVSVPLGVVVYAAACLVFWPGLLKAGSEIVRSLLERDTARLETALRNAHG